MKRKLNSDGHQFHQQHEPSPSDEYLNWSHWKQKNHDTWRWKSRSCLGTGTIMLRCSTG